VDVHVHAVPRPLVDRVAAGELAGVELVRDGASPVLRFPGMAPAPPIPATMLSAAALAAAADGRHIVTQLLAPWTDLFGYTLPEPAAAAWSRAYNEALVQECEPGQVAMATIPLSYPRRAAAELAAARELGCRGVIVGTDVGGLHLGSPELEPVWEAAAALEMPVLVHPTYLRLPGELEEAGLKNAVGRAGPTALALARLLYSGALLRHPALTIVACHGGGAFAVVAPRIVRNHDLGWSGAGGDVDVRASIARLHFDSVVLDPGLLRYLVSAFGADRFLLGSDLPFPWEEDPVGTVLAAGLPPDEQDAVAGGNARRLYGLSVPASCAGCAGASQPP